MENTTEMTHFERRVDGSDGRNGSTHRRLAAVGWLVLSLGVFGVVLARTIDPPPGGEWRDDLAGGEIGELVLIDRLDNDAELKHPAMILFFRWECQPCKRAASSLAEFASGPTAPGLHVYAITIDRIDVDDSARRIHPDGIEVLHLAAGAPQLAFVNQVPMFVTTDAEGRIKRAYVGVADLEVLRQHARLATFGVSRA